MRLFAHLSFLNGRDTGSILGFVPRSSIEQGGETATDAKQNVCFSCKLHSLCSDILISTVMSVVLKELNNPFIPFHALSCLFCLQAPTGTGFNEGTG